VIEEHEGEEDLLPGGVRRHVFREGNFEYLVEVYPDGHVQLARLRDNGFTKVWGPPMPLKERT
jgi:hypothetical protein